MAITLDQLEAEAMSLKDHERAVLAERLVESLASPGNSQVQQAWCQLARARRDAIRNGDVAGIPGAEGLAMIRALVGK